MSVDIVIILILLFVALVLFWSERVPFDVTSVIVMTVLMVTGILTPREGLSGFSNEATLTIAAMFVLSEGMRRTGALAVVGDAFTRVGRHGFWAVASAMMLVVAATSAFINNTAAVAIFIPVTIGVAARLRVSPTKLLMPLSFAAMLGGVCTLVGTSTNLLVSSIAEENGQPPFSMFEFAPLGLVVAAVGFAYLLFGGIRLLPERRPPTDLTDQFQMNEYLTDLLLEPGWEYLGRPLRDTPLTREFDLDVLQVFRGESGTVGNEPHVLLQAGDVLRVRGSVAEIQRLMAREHLRLRPAREWHDIDLARGERVLVEAVLAPDSELVGRTVRSADLTERFGAVVLAIRHRGRIEHERLDEARLSGGDSLLLVVDVERVRELQREHSFVVVSEVERKIDRRPKLPIALAVLVVVVVAAALDLAPIVVTALAGAVLLVLCGCLTIEEAYEAIHWRVILLLAGVLPLGLAMDKTGAATMLSDAVLHTLGDWGPTAVLAGFLLLAMLLTNLISNQATAVLLAPIAIQSAATIGVSPRPFLVAVTFAASLSFMTPVSYQTNTLVYGPGQYRFGDFLKVGTPLNLLLWVLTTLLIPVFWSFAS